jgi:aspartate ammonia-lyase
MLENFLASNMMIDELKANQENHESYLEKIPVLDMLLNLYIGYLKAAEIYKESLKTNKSIKELVLSKVS